MPSTISLLRPFAAILILAVCTAAVHSAEGKVAVRTLPIAEFSSSLDGWEYYGGYEFPGATGQLVREASAGPKGVPCAKLTGDFTSGGSYVAMTKVIEAPCTGVSIRLRTVGCRRVSIRLTDSTGQTFQQEVAIKGTEDWQVVTVEDPDGKGDSWGGAKDKVWHPPASKISIMNCRPRTEGGVSILQVAQVVLRLAEAKP